MSILRTFFICLLFPFFVYAQKIEKRWEIPFGEGANDIQELHYLVMYDFEIYDGKLLLSDIARNQIKMFDSTGNNIETIKLQAAPEIIKTWGDVLIVLIQNGQLGMYDIKQKKLDTLNLGVEVQPYSYSGAYFSDSLLFIPKTDQFIAFRMDAYVVDISKLPNEQTSLIKDAYDIEEKTSYPDSMLVIGKNYSIQQSDFCFNSKDVSIIGRYDKNHPGGKEEYFYYEKKTKRFVNLGIPQDKQHMLLHVNYCSGFKIYMNWIYFIEQKFEKHKGSLIISRLPMPQ